MNPARLLLIDGCGALLTAILLAGVLGRFETLFGMPRAALYPLALLACVCAARAFVARRAPREQWRARLRPIGFANLLYCCLTFAPALCFRERLTAPGWWYFFRGGRPGRAGGRGVEGRSER